MKSILANEFLSLIKLALNQAEKVLHYPNGGIWGCIQRLPSSNFHVNLYFPPFDTRAHKKKMFRQVSRAHGEKLEMLNRALRFLQ